MTRSWTALDLIKEKPEAAIIARAKTRIKRKREGTRNREKTGSWKRGKNGVYLPRRRISEILRRISQILIFFRVCLLKIAKAAKKRGRTPR